VVEAAEKTTGGLLLTEGAKEKPTMGKVVAVGPGRQEEEGKEVKPAVEVGATVLYQKYSGTEVSWATLDLSLRVEVAWWAGGGGRATVQRQQAQAKMGAGACVACWVAAGLVAG